MAAPNAMQLMQNITTLSGAFEGVSLVFGICLFVAGVHKLKRHGEARGMGGQGSSWGPLAIIIASVALMAMPTTLGLFLNAFWQTSSPLAYNTADGATDQYIPAVLMFVRFIGLVAFVRGVHHFAKSGHGSGQPGSIGKGLMHSFGGILCVHILGVVDLIRSFFGM